MNDALFGQIDFGSLDVYLKDDDVTDISYTNNGQLWIKTLSKGIYREENRDVTNALMEKIAFQCSNIRGKNSSACSKGSTTRPQGRTNNYSRAAGTVRAWVTCPPQPSFYSDIFLNMRFSGSMRFIISCRPIKSPVSSKL